MSKVKVPKPLMNYVLIDNPLKGDIVTKYEEEIKLLPKNRQKDFIIEKIGETFEEINVLAVGPLVRDIKAGDKLLAVKELMAHGIPICNNEFIMVKESNFLGKW